MIGKITTSSASSMIVCAAPVSVDVNYAREYLLTPNKKLWWRSTSSENGWIQFKRANADQYATVSVEGLQLHLRCDGFVRIEEPFNCTCYLNAIDSTYPVPDMVLKARFAFGKYQSAYLYHTHYINPLDWFIDPSTGVMSFNVILYYNPDRKSVV